MEHDLPLHDLGLTTEQAQAQFDRLQHKLPALWKSIQTMTDDEQTIVVVPSMSIDSDLKGAVLQAYEERFLFLLLLLRQPRARLIYVTSQAIHPSVIDYYLELLPGVISSHARKRLFLVAPLDGSQRPLSVKLLERPKLIEYIKSLILDPNRAHLVPYNTTLAERDLALRLGIPMYGADPKYFPFGTKSGCRRIFEEEGVPHPLGYEDLHSQDDLINAIVEMRKQKPSIVQVLTKLNEGVSGEGNALVKLENLPTPGSPNEKAAIEACLKQMSFELEGVTYEHYMQKFNERGGIVEERIIGKNFKSPSVQLRVNPLGKLEILSTHDQLLGGPSGQSYLGCIFPANAAYAALITQEAAKVGERLAKEGVIGRFALDFVTVETDHGLEAYAIEINLRKGGTTHPFLTLQFLTDGVYDWKTGIFTAPSGRHKYFIATDHLASPLYKAFTPDDLFDISMRHKLHFDQSRQIGVIFHMMTALAEAGQVGMTAVGESPQEAEALYKKAAEALDQEAQAALEFSTKL
ncbi:MAG TPA: peptide ligase PGM1-related protein [Anaerolineae bacterium]|nr:peptide ligase PGM1-related protein [Anaerolineae bacterium]